MSSKTLKRVLISFAIVIIAGFSYGPIKNFFAGSLHTGQTPSVFVELINAKRSAQGLPALAEDAYLAEVAYKNAVYMAEHSSQGGDASQTVDKRKYPYDHLGWIFVKYTPDVFEKQATREVFLNRVYRDVGVAIAASDSGQMYIAVLLGVK